MLSHEINKMNKCQDQPAYDQPKTKSRMQTRRRESGQRRQATKQVHRGNVVRKLVKRAIMMHTSRMISTSDVKSHVRPLAQTSARNTARHSVLFIVTPPYTYTQNNRSYYLLKQNAQYRMFVFKQNKVHIEYLIMILSNFF